MKASAISPILLTLLISEVVHARHSRKGVSFSDEEDSEVALPTSFQDTPTKFFFRQGQQAKLECSLNDLGTKKVIWRRKSDPNPLTIGRKTFVDDRRISIEHQAFTSDWHLYIKQVRLEDSGQYECQVSSKNRQLRRYVTLEVRRRKKQRLSHGKQEIVRKIDIHGETFVEKNGRLMLVCNATGGGHSPDDLDWFRNGQILGTNLDKKVLIEERVSLTEKTIYSTLVVDPVDMQDAGIYLCRTSDLQIASKRVDVLNAGTNNVKRGTEKDSSASGKTKGGTKSDLRDEKNTNSSKDFRPSRLLTYSIMFVSILAAKISQEIFSPT